MFQLSCTILICLPLSVSCSVMLASDHKNSSYFIQWSSKLKLPLGMCPPWLNIALLQSSDVSEHFFFESSLVSLLEVERELKSKIHPVNAFRSALNFDFILILCEEHNHSFAYVQVTFANKANKSSKRRTGSAKELKQQKKDRLCMVWSS